jgi:hypothetical protein
MDTSTENSPLTETTYYNHESAKAKEFIQQTIIGACISSFIHFKFGVNQVVVIQSVMVPLNLYDNVILKKHVFGIGGPRHWEERLEGESLNSAVSSSAPNAIPPAVAQGKGKKGPNASEAIMKAWDMGVEANFEGLMSILSKGNQVKTKTSDGWTALMVACGSPIDTEDIIKRLVKLGVPIRDADNDGWTALHWCAFHGRPEAAQTLLSSIPKADADFLKQAKDSQGRTAAEVAAEEENADVADIITSTESSSSLRQRKPTTANDDTLIDDVD